MRISVQLFAGAAEAAGCRTVDLLVVDRDTVTIAEIKQRLGEQFPLLAPLLQRAWCACNDEYVTGETHVKEGDQIAVIPPVSGGQSTSESPQEADIAVVRTPLSPALMHERMADARAGAVVVFAGTVREFTRGRQTLRLEYEAYDRMALAKLQEVKEQCEARWPIVKMAIWHRVGLLELTEVSVLIGVATPHRHDAFAAAEHAIVTLKKIVPIWKKESFADGSSEWLGPDGPWEPVENKS